MDETQWREYVDRKFEAYDKQLEHIHETQEKYDIYFRGNGRAGIHTWLARIILILMVIVGYLIMNP